MEETRIGKRIASSGSLFSFTASITSRINRMITAARKLKILFLAYINIKQSFFFFFTFFQTHKHHVRVQ